MAGLGIAICENIVPNQGAEDCVVQLAKKERPIAIPKGTTTDATFWATPEASLKAKFIHDNPALRWFAPPRFQEMTPEVQAATVVTAADGSKFIPKDGSVTWSFMLKDNSQCAQQSLLLMDNMKKDWLFLQNNRTLLGQKKVNAATPFGNEMAGYKPQLCYVAVPTDATDADVTNGSLQLNFVDPKTDFKNMIGAVLKDIDLNSLIDEWSVKSVKVQLSATIATTGVVKFKLYSCGGTNLGIVYATELNSAALFTMVNGTAGTTLAKTLALNAVTGEFTITATTPPAASTPMIIGLAAVSALAAAGVEYHETPAHALDGTAAGAASGDTFKLTVINI